MPSSAAVSCSEEPATLVSSKIYILGGGGCCATSYDSSSKLRVSSSFIFFIRLQHFACLISLCRYLMSQLDSVASVTPPCLALDAASSKCSFSSFLYDLSRLSNFTSKRCSFRLCVFSIFSTNIGLFCTTLFNYLLKRFSRTTLL